MMLLYYLSRIYHDVAKIVKRRGRRPAIFIDASVVERAVSVRRLKERSYGYGFAVDTDWLRSVTMVDVDDVDGETAILRRSETGDFDDDVLEDWRL